MIRITTFRWAPPFAQGLVRDVRLRWALEEAGLAYEEQLVSMEETKGADYRSRQPFGQVPVYEEEGSDEASLSLFETGAILLHIATRSPVLLPEDPAGKARATVWLLAALNTIEPPIQQLAEIDLFHSGEAWTAERRPQVAMWVERRLGELADALGDKDYLDGLFSVGDLMMATVLRILRHTDMVAAKPPLRDYLARCEARPAFQRALADHMAVFGPDGAAPSPRPNR